MKELIDKFLKNVKADIIEDQEVKDIRSSGRSADSLKETATEKSGELRGLRYIGAQRFGRKPGKFPPIEDIKDWIEQKGIQSDIPADSLAFLIARKIAREGTDIYNNKRPALAVSDILDIRLDEFKGQLLEDQIKQIKDSVVTSLKTILQ